VRKHNPVIEIERSNSDDGIAENAGEGQQAGSLTF
jgi:hypothetical protein